MKVLIIDDDQIDTLSIVRTLKNTDLPLAAIETADTGVKGLELALQHQFDVILLDYQLPPTDGFELLIELRAKNDFSTSIVMLSHNDDEDIALKCIESGAQDFILKSEVTAVRLRRAIVIASERHQLEQQVLETHTELKRLAERDSLTGLNNRHFFEERLTKKLLSAAKDNSSFVLMLIDVDKFKDVNDRHGHVLGDGALKEVASKLNRCVGYNDILCRLGGDEFALLFPIGNNKQYVQQMVNRLMSEFSSSICVDEESLDLTVSVGIASFPECASNSIELRKCADIALYRAKEKGRNQAQFYSKAFHEQMNRRAELERHLKKALVKSEMELYYQPQFNADMKLIGAEALLRWKHPKLGMIPPDSFIPVAEETGMIVDIGFWVIGTALKQLQYWLNEKTLRDDFTLAINLSPSQLTDQFLAKKVKNLLNTYGIPASRVEFEITESNLISGEWASEALQKISDLGVKVAVDDFGTGYSSLSHLKDYTIDVIKIDRSFVERVELTKPRQLFTAICAFSHSLEYDTVAEGIETEIHDAICKEVGVTRLQGFYYSKPLPVMTFESKYLYAS
ncbi:putative bifunctional diguanylate cyclase/phosphodiesterase [Vibrio cyclitrophicus]|uniref:putative bifunctional diguanylate cyclase/phosphodiesterase n=1 Tax=Vibrio cyclitrophicus TaxID=47951 RepID=UPI000C8662C2|nr:GGDEF domain-containing response regulator [Vibrio cyclitrophicus]PMH39211.1 diguanylate cyclase [Vibrio cyclitrophicus]